MSEWNRRLVAAVFHDQVDLFPELRRIDATDSFLAGAGDFEDVNRGRASFLEAMPQTENGVRGLFESTVMRGWTPDSDDLPFYAQLHLTILAASTDESLQDEGNFRRRLAQMLGLDPSRDYVSGGRLPELWKCACRWSINRANRRGDTRRLILPEPGAQTIIGYSKRLAFPEFRDQNRLAEIFTRTGIDSTSPLSRLMRELRPLLSEFSDRFQEEFYRFAKLLETGDKAAACETIFWESVEETTWARVRRSGTTTNAVSRLEIDPTDPFDPEFCLYCPEAEEVGSDWVQVPEDRLEGGLVGWRPSASRSAMVLDRMRLWLSDYQHRTLIGHRLIRALGAGCIGFVQKEDGYWLDTQSLPESGSLWLALHRDNDRLLDVPTGQKSGATVFRAPLHDDSKWTLLGPIDVNDTTRSWFNERASNLDFFLPRLMRRRITVVESIKQDDGAYLYLPPVIPAFRCTDARSGIARVGEADCGSYPLSLQDDRLVLPNEVNDLVEPNTTLRVVAFDASKKEIAHGVFRFSDVSSALVFKGVRTPSAWLESCLEGRLQTYSPDLKEWGKDASYCSKPIDGNIRPLSKSHSRSESPVTVDLSSLDERWMRTTEILSAIFARRYAFPIGECVALLEKLWGSVREAWAKLDDLVDNGIVRVLHTRHWSSRVVVACPPVIVVHAHAADVMVRIVGLLSTAMGAVVHRVLGERCRVLASPDRLTGGALEYHLDSTDDLLILRAETDWPQLRWDELPVLDLPAFETLMASPVRADLQGYADDEKTFWSPRLGVFVQKTETVHDTPRLERWRAARQQDLFVLYRKDGSMWNTDCRKWGLLALATEWESPIGHVLDDGTIRLHHPSLSIPVPLAWRTVAGGGGVCFRESSGQRIYPASAYWSPATACAGWKDAAARTKHKERGRLAATERYAFLLERERKAQRLRIER